MKSASGNNSDTVFYIVLFLLFLVMVFIGSAASVPFLIYLKENHAGMFFIYKRTAKLFMPLYKNWALALLIYYFVCFTLAWIIKGKTLNLGKHKDKVVPALCIALLSPFVFLALLKYVPAVPFGLVFPLYFLSLLFAALMVFVYKRTNTKSLNSMLSPMFDRIRQCKNLYETEYSFNWKTSHGYVNILNPFQGIGIISGAGGGKSWTIIEPIIDQAIEKGFTSLVYDFKFPTLGLYTYNAFMYHKEKNPDKVKGNFYYINFKDIRYSHRANPLHPRLLERKADAAEASTTILYNINKNWAQKSGEFFSDSAITILTSIIWYLRLKAVERNKNICTLPHVVAFCSYDNMDRIIDILCSDVEIENDISALRSAKNTGAGEQLGGQLGSLQIAMSKINDPAMAWVTSGDDFSLDINNPKNPAHVVLGNDDRLKKAFSPAISLFASTIAGKINQQGKLPCAFIIDEFPTIFIQNIENLPNTGRSNKISTILCMQDFSQLKLNYGDKAAEVVRATFINVFVGQTSDKNTAQYAADVVGKGLVERTSMSINNNDTSYSISQQMDYLLLPDEIMKLNKGEFVGKVSDIPDNASPKDNSDSKTFAAYLKVSKPTGYYKPGKAPEKGNKDVQFRYQVPKTISFEGMTEEEELAECDRMIRENIVTIRKEIVDLITWEYWTLKIRLYLKNNPLPHIRDHYEKLIANNGFDSFCEPYVEYAESAYQMVVNGTGKRNPNVKPDDFVFEALTKEINAQLEPTSEIIE